MAKFQPCPDFDLAPLEKLPANILVTSDPEELKLNGFMLSLSLIFNDIKGLLWVFEQLVKGQPQGDELTSYMGQWCGFNSQFKRMVISTLNELLEMVEENKQVLTQNAFLKLIEKLDPKFKKSWDDIVNHALQSKFVETPLRKFLRIIRHNIGHHYFVTKNFLKGYELWRAKSNPSSLFAGFSLGNSMESTRFFFADAASDAFLEDAFSKHQLELNDLKKIINQVNEALRFLLQEFINTKR